jgi:hypothetical protein
VLTEAWDRIVRHAPPAKAAVPDVYRTDRDARREP